MDNQIQSSFIPKKTTPQPTMSMPARSNSGSGFLTTIAFIVLLISLVLAGGAYAYKLELQKEINAPCADANQTDLAGCGLLASLNIQKNNLKVSLLSQMQRLDLKLKIADSILSKHVTLIPLFQLINSITVKSVRYTSFGLKDNEVTLKGIAPSYEDVAVQAKKYYAEKTFINPIFSDLDTDAKNAVNFKIVFKVDPSFLLYTTYVDNNPEPVLTSTTTTTSNRVVSTTTSTTTNP